MYDAQRFINYLSVATDLKERGSMSEVVKAAEEFGCRDWASFVNLKEIDIDNQLIFFNDSSSVFFIMKIPGNGVDMFEAILPPTMTSVVLMVFSSDDAKEMVKEAIDTIGTERFLNAMHLGGELFVSGEQGVQ